VRSRLGAWRRIGAPSHILRWLREGVRCEWRESPPPPFDHGVSRVRAEDRAWATQEADRCLQTGAFVRATCFDFVSKAFIVSHNGKRRLVFNLKHLNEFCVQRSCRFGSLAALRRLMRQGDLMWSIDLSDAYHHIGIHRDDQKYFTFALETERGVEYFSTAALNFGWCRSPAIFTEVMKPIVSYLRNPDVAAHRSAAPAEPRPAPSARAPRVLPWLDDFAFFFTGPTAEAQAARDHSFSVFTDLGITRNERKGQPEPSTMLHDHLGYGIDSESMQFLLTEKRERKLRLGARALLSHSRRHHRLVSKRQLAAFAGLAQSSGLALRLVRLWLRAIYDAISSRAGWSGSVRLDRQAASDLLQFTQLQGSRMVGRPIALRPDTAAGSVDAGPLGWGGQLQRGLPPVAGFWSPAEAAKHITWRELRALRLFIESHLQYLEGRRLLMDEDNQAVVAMVLSFTSKSTELVAELRLLAAVLEEHDIDLRARYIRSKDNVVADYYSRIARRREYTVSRDIFDTVQAWWGRCTVDAFASDASALLPRFWSETSGGAQEAADAFAQRWGDESLVWAHPPPSMLPQLVQLLESEPQASALVCTPHWPGSHWFRALAEMADEMATFPPGAFSRIAYDAPALLETWGATVFRVSRATASSSPPLVAQQ
jgi:hypothetical protein